MFIISVKVMTQPRETGRADCVYFIDRTPKIFWDMSTGIRSRAGYMTVLVDSICFHNIKGYNCHFV